MLQRKKLANEGVRQYDDCTQESVPSVKLL